MGKRKHDKGKGDSSSSDAKRCRSCHCQNGETSRPSDGMPPSEGLADIVRAVIELKDVMQIHFRLEEKFKRKFRKLKENRKKDKEDVRVLKEELESKFQEMQKEACAEVNHYKASPCQRSQLRQSTKFRLVIENSVSRTIYKRETVETEDGGGHIKVVMYDGGNPIASDHRLASVRVELVVIEGGFDEKRDSWSKEEFEESIIKPRRTTTLTSLVKNGTFNLIGGSCDHDGAVIMDNSQQREVKLGVRITVPTETRVLEGVSNPFKVQEAKTKKPAPNKMGKKPSPPVPTRNSVLPTRRDATQHERGKDARFCTNGAIEDNRLGYPQTTMPLIVEGNGLALNNNSQQSYQQIPTPNSWQPISTHYMEHGQGSSLPPPSMPNPLQVAGYYPPLPSCGQDGCTSLSNANSQVLLPNLSGYGLLDGQWSSIPRGEISVEDVNHSNVQLPIEEYYIDASFRCGQILLQWDKPHVELKEHWNFLDRLMPLYSTQPRFYRETFPSTSLMDKAHKLLASISSGDSIWKTIASLECRATQTPQRRGVLIRSIEKYDSDDGPPVKKQMNAKYQLRFVNRVSSDYYTWEQIKSEDGNLLKVALYDESNLVVTSGPLSSASVEVVLLHGDFNAEGQDYWTLDEFNAGLVHPQSLEEPPALGGDRVLALTDGEAAISNVYFQTSSFHARTGNFKMGVKIKNAREESVQEGITSTFVVRVREGAESSCHQTTSLKLLGVRIELPEQVCGALECDARENVGPSSALEDKDKSAESVGKGAVALMRKPRRVWTPQLHKRFVDAVAHLGIKNAVPNTIMRLMSVDGLSIENVASHLQKYRLYLRRMQRLGNKEPLFPSDHIIQVPTPVPHSLSAPTAVPRSLHECQASESLHLKTKEIDTSYEDFAADLMRMYNHSKDFVGDSRPISPMSEAFSDLMETETFSEDEPSERKIDRPEPERPSLFNVQSQYS